MPLRALEDALHAQVADVVVEHEREFAAREAKQPLDEETGHMETAEFDEQKK